ncbi:MAG: glycosyl hydrolase family 18 protein [Defluviitaleaceae bacterium]|nr:glycosyl hydrolase family 18 protein [Defluviitaleaceae bacterium]
MIRQRGSAQMRYSKAKKQNNEKIVLFVVLASTVLMIGLAATLFLIFRADPIQPNMETITFHDYHNLDPNSLYVVLEGELLEDFTPLSIAGEIHLPYDFLLQHFSSRTSPHFYWEPELELLTVTTQTELIRIQPGAAEMYLNRALHPAGFAFQNIGGVAYLPLSFVEPRFDIRANLTASNLLVLDNTMSWQTTTQIIMEEEAHIRHLPDIQSYIVETIPTGGVLHVFPVEIEVLDEETEQYITVIMGEAENYTRVRTSSGAIGFVYNEEISEEMQFTSGYTVDEGMLPPLHSHEPLIVAWDLVTVSAANYLPATRVVHQGVNVMAPKWFRFEREYYTGTLENISSLDYVNWAHANGMQVWPLLFDYEDPQVATQILSQTYLRDYVINQLMQAAITYNFDGIMIDIEGTNPSNQVYFLQFLRELSPIMREYNLVYSAAVFVPAPWRGAWFNHGEIGRVVDYLAVMAYDQHVASVANIQEDATAGPNASIDFVQTAVRDLVAVMDSDRIILGLPFYTRIWYIRQNEFGQNVYEQRHVGIQFGQSYFADAGVPLQWSEEYGSYFASFTTMEGDQEVTTLAWVETERSLELKARLVEQYGLAGVAGWQRSLATPGVWAMLDYVIRQ